MIAQIYTLIILYALINHYTHASFFSSILLIHIMDQAYQNFNAGKYKEALNNLNTNPTNHQSYQPNLAICEYLANRNQQTALNCLRRLNDLLARKNKRDKSTSEPQTLALIKFNISVLLILLGKRESAILVLQQIYKQKDCFIEFMQSRVFLLLLELYTFTKNTNDALNLYRYFVFKPIDQRNQNQQWASVVWHQHGKTFAIAREELTLVARIYINQVLMQMGVRVAELANPEQEKMKEEVLGRVRKRKNAVNKYYELNISLICRFAQAYRQLYARNYSKCLSLMNYTTIAEQFQQMPTTKIVTNIVSAFVTSNAGLVHFHYGMPSVALSYFAKAKVLLTKAYTGVQDRDLHLFSLNYGSFLQGISLNQALALLSLKSKESYQYFQSFRKSNQMSKSYKFWYRMAQSALISYHDPKTLHQSKMNILNNAINALNNALLALDKVKIPTFEEMKNLTKFTQLKDEQIQATIMKMKSQTLKFRQSTLTLMCYVSLGLGLWRRVIKIGRALLQDKKLDSQNRLNVLNYLLQAETQLGKNTVMLKDYFDQMQLQINQCQQKIQVLYINPQVEIVEQTDHQTLYSFQAVKANILQGNITQAMKHWQFIKQKHPTSLNQSICDAITYMHRVCNFDKKFILPYLIKNT